MRSKKSGRAATACESLDRLFAGFDRSRAHGLGAVVGLVTSLGRQRLAGPVD